MIYGMLAQAYGQNNYLNGDENTPNDWQSIYETSDTGITFTIAGAGAGGFSHGVGTLSLGDLIVAGMKDRKNDQRRMEEERLANEQLMEDLLKTNHDTDGDQPDENGYVPEGVEEEMEGHIKDNAGANEEKINNQKELERLAEKMEGSLFHEKYGEDIEKLTNELDNKQGPNGPIAKQLDELFSDMKENPDDYKFIPDPNMSKEDQIEAEKRFNALKAYIKDLDYNSDEYLNLKETAGQASRGTCWMQSLWEYGVSNGTYNKDFKTFYMEQLQKGNVGNIDSNGNVSLSWVIGSPNIMKEMGITNVLENIEQQGTSYEKSDFSSMDSDQKYLDELNNSGKQYAVLWVNNHENGSDDQNGKHYLIAKKSDDGKWYWYDHNGWKRGDEVIWSRVYSIKF